MKLEELQTLPMTELEKQLKKHLYKIPGVENRNLTSQELSDYIQSLIKAFGSLFHGRYSTSDIDSFTTSPEINLLTSKLLEGRNITAFSDWSEGLSFQKESRHVNIEQDVSVSRMLRYMPAHWHTSRRRAASRAQCIHFQSDRQFHSRRNSACPDNPPHTYW